MDWVWTWYGLDMDLNGSCSGNITLEVSCRSRDIGKNQSNKADIILHIILEADKGFRKMKLHALIPCIFYSTICFTQVKVTKMDKSSLPKNIEFNGKMLQGLRWTDSTGGHMVILTKTEITESKKAADEGYNDGGLYAYHFALMGDSIRQTWRVYDYVKECPVDMFLYFIEKSFAVTDLDKDGRAEVWIMYKVSCQGDVSPIPMKIIMYEDDKKFAIRGTTRVRVSETEYMGGEFSFDDAFKKAPAAFRAYAEKLWMQHKVEDWKH